MNCQLCDKSALHSNWTLIMIYKQVAGEIKKLYVCHDCYDRHQRELELTRQNFYLQFGEN